MAYNLEEMSAASSGVSAKIRAAIKAKLEELGVYVDEELPDYIMVMIANKKEKAQMKEDLLLFLGKNSEKFVDWLFDIFARLQMAAETGVAAPSESDDSSRSKKKDTGSSHRKERSKEEDDDDRKRDKKHDGGEKKKESAKEKEHEKHKDKERDAERKEKDKHEPKIVKSKPSHSSHHRSPSPVREKPRTHKKIEYAPESREKDSNRASTRGGREKKSATAAEKSEKVSPSKALRSESSNRKLDEKSEKMRKGDERTEVRRRSAKESSPKRHSKQSSKVTDAGTKREAEEAVVPKRRKKITPPSPDSVHSQALDSDEEERIAEEESIREMRSKKVQSTAVIKMAQPETVKTVSSQVIVKRKLPEKENAEQSRGIKSLFLKAIKEAGETTRTASQIAGYGGGAPSNAAAKKKVEPPKNETEEDVLSEEEGIEIDDYDDMEDTLVVMHSEKKGGSRSGRSVVQNKMDECDGSEQEGERYSAAKRSRIIGSPSKQEETKFFITLEGDRDRAVATRPFAVRESRMNDETTKPCEKPRKRRNEANPILAHLNIPQRGERGVKDLADETETVTKKPRKEDENDDVAVGDGSFQSAADAVAVGEASSESRRTPVWDGQIQLEEDDSSDDEDNEAQIDAVLASTHEIPPTPTLTKSSFFVSQVQAQSAAYGIHRSNIYSFQNRNASQIAASTSGEKLKERCKFWPNCRLEENCIYIHPSKPCSNFPNCHFADRCIYIHPPCKFDRSCTNPRCPYSHSSKIGITATSTPSVLPSIASSSAVTQVPTSTTIAVAAALSSSVHCKFGGKCANPNCTFKHPKMCRFGDRCTNRGCYFRHLKMNSVGVLGTGAAKYKWTAPSTAA